MEQRTPLLKIIWFQSAGFLAIIALTWLDELIALPSLIFGDQSLILDFRESALKMLLVLMVWFLVAGSTRRVLSRVRYLEGFMHVCAWCHRINFRGEWISMEKFLQRGFDTRTSHGICPICLAKEQADLTRSEQAAADDAPSRVEPPPEAA